MQPDVRPKNAILRFFRNSAKENATARLAEFAGDDFEEMTSLVYGMESDWKQNHTIAHRWFKEMCSSLNAHKDLLALFPSQSIYTSVFCGNLALLVGVNTNLLVNGCSVH
jgi:hypothetical protein